MVIVSLGFLEVKEKQSISCLNGFNKYRVPIIKPHLFLWPRPTLLVSFFLSRNVSYVNFKILTFWGEPYTVLCRTRVDLLQSSASVEGFRMLSVIPLTSPGWSSLLSTGHMCWDESSSPECVGDHDQVISKVHIFNSCKDVEQISQYHTALPRSSF